MEQQTMGKRITMLRKSKGMTQEQLAEKVGVTPQAVSKWENDISCPDISILPILANTLGVTADELLGSRPVEPRVVVVEKNKGEQNTESASSGFHISDADKRGGVSFAVILIVLGVAFLLNRTGVLSFNVWNIIWPAVILGLGVAWCVNSFSPFALGVGLLGLYFLLFNLGATSFVLTWNFIWPSLLILLGLTILFDKLWPNRWKKHFGHDGDHTPVSEYSETNGYIHYDCSFSEENRRVTSETLSGGSIDVSFGKSVLDLSNVKTLTPGARLDVDVSFGSFELLLPRYIRLQQTTDKAFGSIQIKGEPSPDATAVLLINGDVSFSSMMVTYL